MNEIKYIPYLLTAVTHVCVSIILHLSFLFDTNQEPNLDLQEKANTFINSLHSLIKLEFF